MISQQQRQLAYKQRNQELEAELHNLACFRIKTDEDSDLWDFVGIKIDILMGEMERVDEALL